jgi:large subunit ribosomal protein L15
MAALLRALAVRAAASFSPLSRGAAPRLFASGAAAAAGGASSAPALPPLSSVLDLSSIRDNAGARKRTRRKGRGVGSGHGLARSAGEGTKGQKSHEGGAVSAGFEGGQAPLWRRTPKIGVAMPRALRTEPETLNLGKLQLWIDSGRIGGGAGAGAAAAGSAPAAGASAGAPAAANAAGAPARAEPEPIVITMKTLRDSRLVPRIKYGVKLLARGKERFAARVRIEVSAASAEAIRAVEAAGGSVRSVYYTPLALRALLRPEKFDFPIKSPRPPPNKIGYFLNYRNRGYLSSRLQLEAIRRGEPHAQVPVYVGGGPVDMATDDLHLGGLAGAAAADPAEATAAAAARAAEGGKEGAAGSAAP